MPVVDDKPPFKSKSRGGQVSPAGRCRIFFIFIFFFADLSKIYVAIFFFQKCHPAASWFGGKELPPVHPAVRSLVHGP